MSNNSTLPQKVFSFLRTPSDLSEWDEMHSNIHYCKQHTSKRIAYGHMKIKQTITSSTSLGKKETNKEVHFKAQPKQPTTKHKAQNL